MTDRETHGNRQAITSEFMGIVGFGDLSSDAIGALNIIDHKAAILRANLAERDERIDELEAALRGVIDECVEWDCRCYSKQVNHGFCITCSRIMSALGGSDE